MGYRVCEAVRPRRCRRSARSVGGGTCRRSPPFIGMISNRRRARPETDDQPRRQQCRPLSHGVDVAAVAVRVREQHEAALQPPGSEDDLGEYPHEKRGEQPVHPLPGRDRDKQVQDQEDREDDESEGTAAGHELELMSDERSSIPTSSRVGRDRTPHGRTADVTPSREVKLGHRVGLTATLTSQHQAHGQPEHRAGQHHADHDSDPRPIVLSRREDPEHQPEDRALDGADDPPRRGLQICT